MFRPFRFALAAAAVLGLALPSFASPIVTAESVIVHAPDTTGTFNVFISVPLGDAPIQLGGFDITVSTSGAALFTAADYPASNYVFAPANSAGQFFGDPIDFLTPGAGTSKELFDNVLNSGSFTTINPGDTFLLGTISFSVPPYGGTPVVYGLTVSGFLSDDLGADIPFTTANGTITQVPEPATIVVFGALAAAGFGVRRRKLAKA